MKTFGIICEYNPFHYGHLHHIQQIKKIHNPDVLVCVMSSNFVQRGEPAIINKWERAKTAVEHGVDLVIELPFIYSVQSANHFAQASVELLHLAHVDTIVFGSETNDIEKLNQLALVDTSLFNTHLKAGISSAKAYEQIYGELDPNDILGMNYIKYASPLNINTYSIQRTNQYHETTMNEIHSSASAIRNAVYTNHAYESQTPMKELSNTFQMKNYYPYIKTLLLTSDPPVLSKLFLMDEGIENLLIKNIKIANSYEEFIQLCISKRYTKAKIQRTLVHLMNQTTKQEVNALTKPNYLRILAFNDKGQSHIKALKEDGIHIASKFNQIPAPYQAMELKATHVYQYPLINTEEQLQSETQAPLLLR